MISPTLTFVTVVFEPDLPLLRLQARSFARYLPPDDLAELIILDNCAGGMGRRARQAVLRALGPELRARCTVLRTRYLGVSGSVEGWRSQQAAKLLIARRVSTPHYVVLDAKNHLIASAQASDFVFRGRARGGTHPYTTHPLRAGLERTLRYLEADEATISQLVKDFPPTHTPFVINTESARRMLADVEQRSGEPFAVAFERAQALEFFLYSGWSILRGTGSPVDGTAIEVGMIWPRAGRSEVALQVIAEAKTGDASWFAVHRRVLAKGSSRTRAALAELWVERGLLTPSEARRFLIAFRLGFVPAMLRARVARRLSQLRRSG